LKELFNEFEQTSMRCVKRSIRENGSLSRVVPGLVQGAAGESRKGFAGILLSGKDSEEIPIETEIRS
jgi:hypothetical protein